MYIILYFDRYIYYMMYIITGIGARFLVSRVRSTVFGNYKQPINRISIIEMRDFADPCAKKTDLSISEMSIIAKGKGHRIFSIRNLLLCRRSRVNVSIGTVGGLYVFVPK